MKYLLYLTMALAANTVLANTNMLTTTVTADRKAESNNDTNTVQINHIDAIHATHISEVLVQSPGTWISRGNGQEQLTAIRSPVLTGSGGCGPFLMAEDNVPLRASAFCNVNQLFDANYEQADSIEVLRGPGTALYGSSAMHGIINIISPNFSDKPYTDLTAELENSHHAYRLGVDHRESHWLLQANTADDNGYKRDSGYNQQKLRFKFLQTSDATSVVHNLNIQQLEQQTAGYVVGKNSYKDDSRKRENPNPDAFRNAESLRYSATINYVLDEKRSWVITPYLRINNMEFLMHFQPGEPIEKSGHHSVGMQTAFYYQWLDNINVITGIDSDYSQGFLKQTQNKAGPSLNFPIGVQYDYAVDVFTIAAFAQSHIALTDTLALTLGNRIENAQYRYNNLVSDGTACLPAATNCRYIRPADNTLNFYNWSPKLTLSWNAFSNNYFYTTLATGYRAPDSSELFRLEQGQTIANIDSEFIRSAEIGWNGSIDQRIRYQFNLFSMKKGNVIFKDANRQNVDNQKTRHEGIEASINADITPTVNIDVQLSYAKHRYDSNIKLIDGSTAFIKGNFIDTAPKQMYHINITWQALTRSAFSLEAVYLDRYYLDPANQYSYPGHTLTNFRYQQQLPNHWQISAGIYNLLNIDYADRADITAVTLANPIAQERYFIGEPRSFRLSISTRL